MIFKEFWNRWRRLNELWRVKRELLLAVDKAMQELGYGCQPLEVVEIYCLRVGLLQLQAALIGQAMAQKAEADEIRGGAGDTLNASVH